MLKDARVAPELCPVRGQLVLPGFCFVLFVLFRLLTCRFGRDNLFKYTIIISPVIWHKAHGVLCPRLQPVNDVESLRGV